MKKFKLAALFIVGLIIAVQFIPIKRDNPTYDKSSEIKTTSEMMKILKTSCYDCHSNETVWPYYSYVAPVSWLVSHDVEEGRKELNFSEWNSYSLKKQIHKLEEIKEHVEEGIMPMPIYLLMHSNANLAEGQKTILYKWVEDRSDSNKVE